MRLKEGSDFWERSGKDDFCEGRGESKTQPHISLLQRPIHACTMNTTRLGANSNDKPIVTAPPNMPSLPPLATLRPDSPQPNSQGSVLPFKALDATIKTEAPLNPPDLRTSRSFHMHNILNPTSNVDPQSVLTPNDSPQTSVSSLSWRHSDRERLTQSPSDMSVGSSTLPGMKGFTTSSGAQLNRLSFAPVPYNNRSYNNVSLGIPSGTIDAKRELFLPTSQTPAPIPRSGAPLLPIVQTGTTPPVTARTSYGFPQQTSPPDRRGPESMTHASSTRSESPCNSLSSYSQMSKASPGPAQYQVPSGHSNVTRYNQHHAARPTSVDMQGPRMGSESNYGALTGANGQATYQLFTLETDQGPIQVPVDVQAASKMADEKRKRNAGASARFRARRKEKERESSQTIANLESKIRSLDEEKEYYRMERDYFRGVVYSTPGQQHIPPRVPSPRLRKGSVTESAGHVKNGSWHGDERGSQNGRNTRRRISATLPFDMSQSSSASSKEPPAFASQPSPYAPSRPPAMHPGARPLMPVMPITSGTYQPQTPPIYDRPWNSVR